MGLLSFLKGAGEKLFGAEAKTNVDAIKKYIQKQGLSTDGLEFTVDGDRIKVSGQVKDQTTKEKIILCCGNIEGVATVDDNITVSTPTAESQYYTVGKGDTLSKIANHYYGDASKYNVIFEANRPMLSSPDKIYPGQKLRIPSLDSSQPRSADRTL